MVGYVPTIGLCKNDKRLSHKSTQKKNHNLTEPVIEPTTSLQTESAHPLVDYRLHYGMKVL